MTFQGKNSAHLNVSGMKKDSKLQKAAATKPDQDLISSQNSEESAPEISILKLQNNFS